MTQKHSKFNGSRGKIVSIQGPFESMWMRTDRWMSDWFVVELNGAQEGFLEDEIERI